MVKNKNTNKSLNTPLEVRLETVMSKVGMAVVAAATILSIAEIADREGHRAAVVLQPSYALAGATSELENNPNELLMRRGKEEIRHTSATYGEVRRSHSIPGTL